ncbi:DUF3951 domain-containing protein [Halobacillus sp. HZG1]|uniref:DUF3951 domain-containing protein n=1 Tax=Halobacillus sp. HZG1 TaxID=3111769 RepID=UPI002DB62915|nr:DUF3951 domain-containing protein [Halobacillus sp. HZG1]MEC3885305.1 DUF3951 domain-containing protein [Halobacillus sp. HZG1]
MVSTIITVLFSCLIVAVVLRTGYRMFVKKQYPDNSYTPFDYVSGQTETPFHEEDREEEEENDKTGQRYD